jgi:hypothetical protein
MSGGQYAIAAALAGPLVTGRGSARMVARLMDNHLTKVEINHSVSDGSGTFAVEQVSVVAQALPARRRSPCPNPHGLIVEVAPTHKPLARKDFPPTETCRPGR